MKTAETQVITCSCCGRGLLDTEEENVHHGLVPYPDDEGFGLCRECGGDPEATEVRARLGWAFCALIDARVPIVAKHLTATNRERFLALPYERQALFILRLMEEGKLT